MCITSDQIEAIIGYIGRIAIAFNMTTKMHNIGIYIKIMPLMSDVIDQIIGRKVIMIRSHIVPPIPQTRMYFSLLSKIEKVIVNAQTTERTIIEER